MAHNTKWKGTQLRLEDSDRKVEEYNPSSGKGFSQEIKKIGYLVYVFENFYRYIDLGLGMFSYKILSEI